MSNLAYTRPFGTWAPNQPVGHLELADLDAKTVKAPNFAGGGTYAPTSPVIIGGSGLTSMFVNFNEFVSGSILHFDPGSTLTLDHGANVFSSAAITLNGDSILDCYGQLNIGGGATLNAAPGSQVTISGNFETISAGGTSAFGADCFFNAFCDFESSVVFGADGDVSFQGLTTFNGHTSAVGNINLSGAGSIIERVVIGANADATYSASSADLVYVPRASVTANRTYHLDEVGAVNGKKIRFHREDNNTHFTLTLKRSIDDSLICTLGWSSTDYVWTDVQRIGGVWQRVAGQFGGA